MSAFNYDSLGHKYSGHRQTDPHIAVFIEEAPGTARTVLNVGAGADLESGEWDRKYGHYRTQPSFPGD